MDEDLLAAVLRSMPPGASLDPLLQQKSNQVCLLHKVVDLQIDNKQAIAKFLIESKLVDCDDRDESNRTAVERALVERDDPELAKVMLTAELSNLAFERSFYVMIGRGSVPVYQLFTKVQCFSDEEIFRGASTAMIELNARRVPIGEQMKVFVQYQLASYAHDHLSGAPSQKDPTEWQKNFAEIARHWQVLKTQYKNRNHAQLDNEFLFRLKSMHNYLYFVKDRPFLKHLPIMEATFCLAALVEVIERYSGVKAFQFIVNKVNVLEFVGTICGQLVKVERFLEEMKRKLEEVVGYCLKQEVQGRDQLRAAWTKFNPSTSAQENVLNRIWSGLKKKVEVGLMIDEVISSESFPVWVKISCKDRSVLRKLRRIFVRVKQLYSIQRCLNHIEAVMKLDGAIDSQQLAPLAVQRLIQVLGESIKSTKNSPNIPKNTADVLEALMTNLFPDTNKYFREFFSHRYSLAKKLFSFSSKSTTLQTLANNLDFVQIFFSIVFVCSLLEAARVFVGSIRRCRNIEELDSLLLYVTDLDQLMALQGRYFEMIQRKMDAVRRALNTNYNYLPGNEFSVAFLEADINLKLEVIKELNRSLLRNWPVSLQNIKDACQAQTPIGTIHRMADYLLTLTEQREIYQNLHSRWIQNHMVVDSMHGQNSEMLKVDNQIMAGLLLEMERKLGAIQEEDYVENTKQILCDLGEGDSSEEVVRVLNEQLKRYYENIFFLDNKYMVIKQFFKVRKLLLSNRKLAELRVRDELELQNIFDELLNSMRQILKLCGISTVEDLETNIKIVPAPVAMALQSCQLELCEILIAVGYYGDNFHLLKHRLPLIFGRNFRNCLAHHSLSYNVLTNCGRYKELVNAVVLINSKVQLFRRQSSPRSTNIEYLGTDYLLDCIAEQNSMLQPLHEQNYDEAFKIFTERNAVKNSTLPQALFRWELIVDHLLTEMSDWEERDPQGRSVLHRLILAGNCERVELLLAVMQEIEVDARDARGRTPLDYSTSVGCARCIDLLLDKGATPSSSSRRSGIIFHLDDSLSKLLDGAGNDSLAEVAVRSRNLTALQVLIGNGLSTDQLKNCLSLAADLNSIELVKYFLSVSQIQSSSDAISAALVSAIKKRSWRVTSLLLQSGASSNWIQKGCKTAFLLAVEANQRRILFQMGSIDRGIYENNAKLEHPMQIAVRKRAPKMVKYLCRMGFSLLDSGSILYSAVDCDDLALVEEIFAQLDAAFASTKKVQDLILRAIGGLLNRWRTLAYLEDSGAGVTAVFRAVIAGNLDVLKKLLGKSKEVRSFQGIYLKRIRMFEGKKLLMSCDSENVRDNVSVLQECDKMLTCLKEDSNGLCSRSTLQVTLKDNSAIRGIFIVSSSESLTAITETIDDLVDNQYVIDKVLDIVRQRLQHIPSTIYGTLRKDSDRDIYHFILRKESTVLMQSTPNPPSLKSVVNFCNAVGESPLHVASYAPGNIDMLKLLLDNGADPLQFNALRQNPMHLALIGKDAEQAYFLLKFCIDLELKSSTGVPAAEHPNNKDLRPLHLAVHTGKTDCVRLLLASKVNLRAVDPFGRTAAFYATLAPYIPTLKLLLDRDPDLLNFQTKQGKTMVHFSACMNHSQLHQLFFQYKPDLCIKDSQGCTPVELAIGNKNRSWVKAALDYARINNVPNLFKNLDRLGFPAFHLALTSSDVEIVRAVVEYEIEGTLSGEMSEYSVQKLKVMLTSQSAAEGHTPLHGAVIMESLELIEFVLECRNLYNELSKEKIDLLGLLDWYEKSPLDYALSTGKESLVSELLKNM